MSRLTSIAHSRRSRLTGLSLASLFALATSLNAVDRTWDAGGGTDTDFSTAANWSADTVPVSGDNALFGNGAIGTVTSDVTVNIFEVGSNASTTRSTVTQTAGNITALALNTGFNGLGTYNWNGGGISTTGNFSVGSGSGSNGIFNANNSGGTINVAGGLFIGLGGAGNATGVLNLSAGTINVSGISILADNSATNSGTVNQTGGSLNAGGEFWLAANGTGVYTISSGTLTSSSWFVGSRFNGSNATFNMTGGTVVGAQNAGNVALISQSTGTATFNISGGTFTAGGTSTNTAAQIWLSEGAGTATLNISGTGSVTAGSLVNLTLNSGANSTLNLNGGSLTATQIVNTGNGTGIVNFNGGTFKAKAASASLITATRINIRDGGAIIDTNGFDSTISQALVHSDLVGDSAFDGGLTKKGTGTLTLTGANTFTGNIVIQAGTLSINSAFINDSANVSLLSGSIFNLNFSGSDTISSLYIDGVSQAVGTYGAVGSGATYESALFTGTGVLNVTIFSAIPEPSTYAALAGSIGGLAVLASRRRRAH